MSTRSTSGGTLVQTLLLVEGDVLQAREIEDILRPLESHVHIVENCDDAVRTVKKDPDITLIIIDAELVTGHEACDLVERLRNCAGESMMPILFLTGRDDSAFDIEAVFALGAIDEVRGMMSRQLDHMVHLVDDMLDITSLSHDKLTLKRERVDLRTILATALETVRRRWRSLPNSSQRSSFSISTCPTSTAVPWLRYCVSCLALNR